MRVVIVRKDVTGSCVRHLNLVAYKVRRERAVAVQISLRDSSSMR